MPVPLRALDGEIQVSLKDGHRADRIAISRRCVANCRSGSPGVEFFFQPADMVTQILNFGLPAAHRCAVYRRGRAQQL